MPPEKIELVAEAFLLSADAHEAQFRSSGEPYIIHPVAVACSLADMQMDRESIIAALLHDVIEDTDITRAILVKHFGEKVALLVEGVTKLSKIQFRTRAEAQAENFRKMMLAMVEDIRVILIKMADRLHNMQTLDALAPEKRRRIARETMEIYAPIANRLGMNNFKIAFQDLSFKAMYPLRYRVLEECVRTAAGSRRKLMTKIYRALVDKLETENIDKSQIHGREKRLFSIFKKMRNKGLTFAEIMDVYGFRIIANTVTDCYRVLGLVHAIFTPVPGRFKDYIAIPKANGYQSLHTTLFGPHGVPIEIQIRTKEMENTAENGIASHWLYKAKGYASTTEVRTREWLQSLLDMQLRSGNSLEFIENVKIDLFPDEVYVFTPKGDIMELPRGATPVDFAYAVHTEVGNSCIAARVNRRPVPLSYQLVNGQTVEIVRANRAQPNPAWLSFVVTGKAKGAIRHHLKEMQVNQSRDFGKKLLTHALIQYGLTWRKVKKKAIKTLLNGLDLESEAALFYSIGHGERPAAVVAHQLFELCQDGTVDLTSDQEKMEPVLITGAEGLNMHFSTCCYPIPGDAVMGVVSKGRGIEVHASNCAVFANQVRKLTSDQLVHLAWSTEAGHTTLPARLRVETENYRGALADVARAISSAKADIKHFEEHEMAQSYVIFSIDVDVESRQHLARVIQQLRKLKSVMHVIRYREKRQEIQ